MERDSMGPVPVPRKAYYGASTARALINFPISGLRLPRRFIRALGLIKQYAAVANAELGRLDPERAKAIARAAAEVAEGLLDAEFVVDVFQTGSGTSTHMNANEVIAHRAAELLGAGRNAMPVHPNDHVNLGQSSNDVIPTAIHLAVLTGLAEDLLPALDALRGALRTKATAFWPVVKTGRTHLQDATPIRLGQEFMGYTGQVEGVARRLKRAMLDLEEVALGGTAVGTGMGTHPSFAMRVCKRLAAATHVSVRETDHHFRAQSTLDVLVGCSGDLRVVALALLKIAGDICWLGSGPRAGLGELSLPEVQPGSSIMPGKVNPVIPEALIQVCAQVVGNDSTVSFAAHRSILELNTMFPVVAYNLLQSIELLASAIRNFTSRCVEGLTATGKGPERVEKGLALATALTPLIGYDAAAEIATEAASSGRTIREVARDRTSLSEDELQRLLDPAALTAPAEQVNEAGRKAEGEPMKDDRMDRDPLAERECKPCRGGVPPLRGDDLQRLLRQLGSGWQLVNDHHLEKPFAFPDFRQALAFTNRVGELAEEIKHHPDIELSWGKVVVRIWTHKIDGLVEADFILAAKVDRVMG
jgi:fumarate hydratase class II